MKLSPHFTIFELTESDFAIRHGLSNEPTNAELNNLQRLAQSLETVRMVLGHPIFITSGYRSLLVNKGVGGAKNSAHTKGLAADFKCPGFGTPKAICQELSIAGVNFDQLIQEGRWVHFAIPEANGPWRKEILTATFKGGKVSYSRGLV